MQIQLDAGTESSDREGYRRSPETILASCSSRRKGALLKATTSQQFGRPSSARPGISLKKTAILGPRGARPSEASFEQHAPKETLIAETNRE